MVNKGRVANTTGAITHGYSTNVYIDALTWPHDANLMLTDVLYLQLDNTARENKNKYCLAFLALKHCILIID